MSAGLDLKSVFSHWGFLSTLSVAFVGFWVAFIAQIVVEANNSAKASLVGVGWFAIFVQLGIIIGIVYSIAGNTIYRNRSLIVAFLALNIVFAVQMTDSFIYATGLPSYSATAAGWLLSAIVDIIWLLYFAAQEDSLVHTLFNAGSAHTFSHGSTGYNTGPSYARSSKKANSLAAMSTRTFNKSVPQQQQPILDPSISVHEMSQMEHHEIPMNQGAIPPTNSMPLSLESAVPVAKARALYSYSASPDDPNEISFTKNEILDVLDNAGKWWQARKSDGTKGIVPSNYLVLV